MILCLDDILTAEERAEVERVLAYGEYEDGRITAPGAAEVKHNRQLYPESPGARRAQEVVLAALQRHETFLLATRPRAMLPPRFSRYDPGMAYGWHVDDAIARAPLMRYDVSWTLFLSDPADYEGGALVIETPVGEQAFRRPAGGLVLYPTTFLHRVEEVTRGIRLAAVGWVQSLVREAARREILYDLEMARRGLSQREGCTREYDLLGKSISNLFRMWAEP